jgi:hypothetical protein
MIKLFILFFLLSCSSPQSDFDKLCSYAKESATSNFSPEEKALKMAKFIEAEIKSEEVLNIVKVLASVEPSQKYSLLIQGTKELGIKNWTCPELEIYFN